MSKLSKDIFVRAQEFAAKVVQGLNASVSPFHSVQTCKQILTDKGFKELSE